MHGGLDPHFGLAFVCLTDELSYLFCWSEVDNECQPLRPDVWR